MKVVFFDLFETLVTQKQPDRPTADSFAARLGLDLDEVRAWWRGSIRDRMTGKYSTYEQTVSALCGALAAPLDAGVLQEICEDRLRRKRAYLLGVESDVLQVLTRLADAGWTLGIVSNTSPDEVASWPECPLRDLVDDVVFSCEIGHMKPDADIYRLACKRLNVAPAGSLFVGDGGSDELRGAAAVGMRPVQAKWYLSRPVEWQQTPALASIDRIEDLFSRLEGMSA